MSEYSDRLKAMSNTWKAGREQPEGVPPGIYPMQLQDVELTESASSGKLMVHWTHLITDGEQAGEPVHDYQGVENERAAFFIGLRIEQLGFETPDDPEELEEVLAAIADAAPTYRGRVTRSKEGFTNIRILNLLESGEAPPPRKTTKKKSKASSEPTDSDSLVGQHVVYRADGEECEVVSQDGDKLTIKDANGDEYACTLADVEVGSGDAGDAGAGETIFFTEGTRVSTEISGETYEGVISEYHGEGEPVLVKFDDGDEAPIAEEALTVLEDQGEAGGETDEKLDELIAFCQSQEVDVSDGDTIEVLTKRIKEFDWDAGKLVKEEVALLESVGVDVIKAKPKAAKKKTGKKKASKKGKKKARK